MASKKRWWPKIGRYLTGFVVVCFFLPFFGISCSAEGQSMDVVKISGADMVFGCKPGGLLAEAAQEESGSRHGGHSGGGLDMKIENVDRELFAVLALGFCVAGFALAWLRSRGALVATMFVALSALGSLGGLYFKVKGNLLDAIDEAAKNDKKGGVLNKDKDVTIDAGGRFGLWIVAGGLLAVVALTGRELAIKDDPQLPQARIAG
jgi:hypothetical protein